MIAPIIIVSLIVVYYAVVGVVFFLFDDISALIKILVLVIPAAFIGVSVFVLTERIKEIRSGEEDDLGKY